MLRAISQHGIDPVIDTHYALDGARQAFARMAESAHIGKIVIHPHEISAR
jgi:NADPH:quinone reductase-like Zn-dependent oxidoreductase